MASPQPIATAPLDEIVVDQKERDMGDHVGGTNEETLAGMTEEATLASLLVDVDQLRANLHRRCVYESIEIENLQKENRRLTAEVKALQTYKNKLAEVTVTLSELELLK